jgi:hypothetical protein
MSQNWQQPQQQPQQPGGYGYPQYGGGAGFPPPAPVRQGNPGLALAAALGAAIVAGLIYGAIFNGLFDPKSGEYTEVGYAGLIAGALVGAVAGKLAPSNVGVHLTAAVLAAGGVVFGQFFGLALIVNGNVPGAPGVTTLFTDHFDLLKNMWQELKTMSFVFIGVAAVESYLISKKVGG